MYNCVDTANCCIAYTGIADYGTGFRGAAAAAQTLAEKQAENKPMQLQEMGSSSDLAVGDRFLVSGRKPSEILMGLDRTDIVG